MTMAIREMRRDSVPVTRHCGKIMHRFLEDQVKSIWWNVRGPVCRFGRRGQVLGEGESDGTYIHGALAHVHVAAIVAVAHVAVIHM
jgi:hypothetical protein